MAGFIETFRGVVYPWHCDQMGHMNVQHYVGMFDQGEFHLMAAAGFRWVEGGKRAEGFADVQHLIQFKAEQRVGSLIVIEGGVLRIGNSSVTLYQRMKNTESGEVAATTEITAVYFDLEARKSRPLPDRLREGFSGLLVEKEG